MKFKSYKTEFIASESEEGIVEAYVSVFNNVDSYGDIVKFGAFTDSLEDEMPRVVWQHDLQRPIGKTILAIEMDAGDERLPDKLRPYGALYVKGAFNLATRDGRDAYEHVKFGSVNEYSFGYEEQDTTPQPDGTKFLNKLRIIEWSPVTIGANPLTMTNSIKAMSLTDKLSTAVSLLNTTQEHAHAYVEMRGKAGRVLNSRIRELVYALANQSKELANELFALYKETEPIKRDETEDKKALLMVIQRNIQLMEFTNDMG